MRLRCFAVPTPLLFIIALVSLDAHALQLTDDPDIDHAIVTIYDSATGALRVQGNRVTLVSCELVSDRGLFVLDKLNPDFVTSPFDQATDSKLFTLRTSGVRSIELGCVLPPGLSPAELRQDLSVNCSLRDGLDNQPDSLLYVKAERTLWVGPAIGLLLAAILLVVMLAVVRWRRKRSTV